MASNPKISYQRLKNEGVFDEIDVGALASKRGRLNSWRRKSRRIHIRKKLKIKIPSLNKFLRRKAKVVVNSWSKIIKRLKESQAHFGDLFAGNYLFMQVTPTSLKCLEKSSKSQLYDFGSGYHLPKVS